jgi:hypothetical protein
MDYMERHSFFWLPTGARIRVGVFDVRQQTSRDITPFCNKDVANGALRVSATAAREFRSLHAWQPSRGICRQVQ